MRKKKESSELYWIVAITLLLATLFFVRSMPLLIPTVLLPLSIMLMVYALWQSYYSSKNEPQDQESNQLQQLVDNCNLALEQLSLKTRKIRSSRLELEAELKQSTDLDSALRNKTLQLIEDYKEQAKVIDAKKSFYLEMKEKIEELMRNESWKRKLKAKQEELEQLQTDHYSDVEKMENIKQEVAYSSGFFSAIRQLSEDIESSSTALDITTLKQELEKLMPK